MKSVIAVAALVSATAAFSFNLNTANAHELNANCDTSKRHTKIVNRCDYSVYLWSINKQLGCGSGQALELKTGQVYKENLRDGTNGGISIKLSKTDDCRKGDITQLEYYLDWTGIVGNYLDMSFVDCDGENTACPGRTDGFYLKVGNQVDEKQRSSVNNEHCPVFNVYNAAEAANVSYILPDDRQTKFCEIDANMDLYLCGGDAPSGDDQDSEPLPVTLPDLSTTAAAPTKSSSSESSPETTSSKSHSKKKKPAPSPSTTEDAYVVAAAAAVVTEAPEVPVAVAATKTEVVYVTKYVDAKRHIHARRHQHRRA